MIGTNKKKAAQPQASKGSQPIAKKTQLPTSNARSGTVDDDRFKEVYTDPRYMQVPKKVRKVEIDERFKKAITSKEFNLVTKVDKYGRKVVKEDNTMLKYYNLQPDATVTAAVTKQKGDAKKRIQQSSDGEDDSDGQEEEEESAELEKSQKAKKYYDDEGKFKWEVQSSSSEESDLDDEEGEESEDEEGEDQDEPEQVKDQSESEEFPPGQKVVKLTRKQKKLQRQALLAEDESNSTDSIWSDDANQGMALDDDGQVDAAQEVEEAQVQVGKRLALTNMDWDNMTAMDILALFSSLCKGEMFVSKVEIYPSLFGLEQMKRDSLYGPPKEVIEDLDQPIVNRKSRKSGKKGKNGSKGKDTKKTAAEEDDEYQFMDDAEMDKRGYNSQQLRKYEFQKMRYYYAVIHCNTKKTATKLYDEYNNYEFELSNIRLQLSFVADDLVFEQALKEVATEVPSDYQFKAASSLSKALNHTNVKMTWDQTDPKRQQKMLEIMEKDRSDDDDDERYKEFLASASDDQEEDNEGAGDSRDKFEEYRQTLLGALTGGDINQTFRKRDLQANDDHADNQELDIRFNVGFGEDLGKKVLKDKEAKKELREESEWQKYQRKRKDKKREKKLQAKEKSKISKIEIFEEDNDNDSKSKKSAELGMLVGKSRKDRNLKADVGDSRFEAVLKNKDYALDPTNKNFRKIADGEFVKEQQTKRRKMHE